MGAPRVSHRHHWPSSCGPSRGCGCLTPAAAVGRPGLWVDQALRPRQRAHTVGPVMRNLLLTGPRVSLNGPGYARDCSSERAHGSCGKRPPLCSWKRLGLPCHGGSHRGLCGVSLCPRHLTRAKPGAATRSAQLMALVPDGECLPCSARHPRETLRTDSEPAVRAGSRSELLATLTTGGIFLTPSCGSLTRTQCKADAARTLGLC